MQTEKPTLCRGEMQIMTNMSNWSTWDQTRYFYECGIIETLLFSLVVLWLDGSLAFLKSLSHMPRLWSVDQFMNRKGSGRKVTWPILRHDLDFLEGLGKTTKTLSQGTRPPRWGLNTGPHVTTNLTTPRFWSWKFWSIQFVSLLMSLAAGRFPSHL